MHKEKLKENLQKLRLELASTASTLDDELHASLKEVADDIETALGDEPTAARPGKQQLQEMAVKFETEHPRLANILGELTDALSKMGI
jgi:NTP pyrophosphatase (non-canonical NTP hydrolase)